MIIPFSSATMRTVRLMLFLLVSAAPPMATATKIRNAESWLTSDRVSADLRGQTIPLSRKGAWRIEPGDSLRAILLSVLRDSSRMTATVHLQSWRSRSGSAPIWLEGEVHLVYRRSADGSWGAAGIEPGSRLAPSITKMTAAAWKERQQIDEFVAELRGAIERDDRAAVARMVRFPFTGHPAVYDDRSGEAIVRNENELLGRYDSLFSPGFRTSITRSLVWKATRDETPAAERTRPDRCGEPGEYVMIAEDREGVDTFFRFVVRRVGGKLCLHRVVGCM